MAEYTIKDAVDIFKRRKRTVLITSVVFILLSVSIVVYSMPESIYEAETAIKIEKVTTLGELLLGRVTVGDYMATAEAMIKGYDILYSVAKKVGLVPLDVKKEKALATPKYIGIIKEMEERITVEKGRGNILLIKVRHTNRLMAKNIANTVAETYKEMVFYERNKNILELENLVGVKLSESELKLQKSREALKLFREKLEFITVLDEQKFIIDAYAVKQKKLEELRIIHVFLQEKVKALSSGKHLEEEVSKLAFIPGGLGESIATLNSRLNGFKLRENELLLYYTEGHPEIAYIREQKNAVIKQMMQDISMREKQIADEIKLLENDTNALQIRMKIIPDVALKYSVLEKDVAVNEELYNKIVALHQDAAVKKTEVSEEVTVAKYAVEPSIPVNRVTFIGNIIISSFLAIVFGFVGGFIHEAFDTIPHQTASLAELLGIPILSVISDWHTSNIFNLVGTRYPDTSEQDIMRYMSLPAHFISDSAISEQYKTVVPNILMISKEKDIKVVAILHGIQGEGATAYAANLAISISQTGSSVVLIDANFKSPGVHKLFGIKRQPGFTDVLMGNYEWDTAVMRITDLMLGEIKPQHLLSPLGLDNLYILTNGERIENPSTFINSERMDKTIEALKNFFDFVIIDTSPILTDSEASMLISKVDAAIVLTEFERLSRRALLKMRSQLENMRVKLIGLVVNKTKKIEL
ncbi:MAG: polysaccharide biosynthesis tyrosine autokinase [Deltaproteobacteria bacterium]|nr:polysaccharide biosynthesis tyrosine autokinase [Deltaproteobacteria bacterium]